jgi:hypothetical protein
MPIDDGEVAIRLATRQVTELAATLNAPSPEAARRGREQFGYLLK